LSARFTPRAHHHSLAIDADGGWTPTAEWPHAIVGEVPWGDAGGAIAWSSSERFILMRSHRGAPVRRDAVQFRPSRLLQMPDGMLVWAAFDGGLWEWTPGQPGRLLIETPKCAGVRVDGSELVLAPSALDAAGRLVRRRSRDELRYRIGESSLRRAVAGAEGAFGNESAQQGWTARSHPYADLISLRSEDGRALVLAVHSPFQVAWAGPSLIVTITDGVTVIFKGLRQKLAPLLLP
jgi:hypothetical protein